MIPQLRVRTRDTIDETDTGLGTPPRWEKIEREPPPPREHSKFARITRSYVELSIPRERMGFFHRTLRLREGSVTAARASATASVRGITPGDFVLIHVADEPYAFRKTEDGFIELYRIVDE